MEFSGLFFLYVLLPLFLLGYFLFPDVGRKNVYLIAVSFLMYALIQPLYAVVIFVISRANFRWSLMIRKGKKKTVAVPLLVNIVVLFVLRYLDPVLLAAGIGVGENGLLAGLIGRIVQGLNDHGMSLKIPVSLVPVGYAFFSLSSISYILDVYHGKYPPEKSFSQFLLYLVMFPKLFQGPLVRYDQVRLQLKQRGVYLRNILEGATRFATGLGKKVLIADFCGRMLLELSESGADQALFGAWLRPILVLFRIYFDLSAACDMAIGLGKILGFKFPENFKRPFTEMSVTEFFEGWNLTVRGFFCEYVYTPLRQRKEGTGNPYIAGFVAMMLMCLWYGGTFNFLLLGLYLAVIFFAEDKFQDFITDLPYWLRHVLTYLALIFCAVLFENHDSASIAAALKAMIGEGGAVIYGDGTRFLNAIPLLILCGVAVSDVPRKFRRKLRMICGIGQKNPKYEVHPMMNMLYWILSVIYILAVFWLSTLARIGAPAVESIFMRF